MQSPETVPIINEDAEVNAARAVIAEPPPEKPHVGGLEEEEAVIAEEHSPRAQNFANAFSDQNLQEQ